MTPEEFKSTLWSYVLPTSVPFVVDRETSLFTMNPNLQKNKRKQNPTTTCAVGVPGEQEEPFNAKFGLSYEEYTDASQILQGSLLMETF